MIFLGATFVGCAQKGFIPEQYVAVELSSRMQHSSKKDIYIVPTIDRLNPDNREYLDPSFSAAAYLTHAFEQELQASGLSTKQVEMNFSQSMSGVRTLILDEMKPQNESVFLASEILWISKEKISFDVILFSETGEELLKKRGLCALYPEPTLDTRGITYLAIKQILADPQFKKALK